MISWNILPEDILSLYTSIPNNIGIATTKKRHDIYIHKTLLTKIITIFLVLIFTLNNFVFDSKFYLQRKKAVLWVQLVFQHMQITSWLNLNKNTFNRWLKKSVLFLRYIDDIFMVWTKSEIRLKDFMSEIDQKYPSLTTNLTVSK